MRKGRGTLEHHTGAPESLLDADTALIPPTSDDFACFEVWFFYRQCRFSGGGL